MIRKARDKKGRGDIIFVNSGGRGGGRVSWG